MTDGLARQQLSERQEGLVRSSTASARIDSADFDFVAIFAADPNAEIDLRMAAYKAEYGDDAVSLHRAGRSLSFSDCCCCSSRTTR